MASICLYDLDFYHGSRFRPNLELMKIFDYYYKKGDIVTFYTKGENLNRYNQIIYFKQSPNIKIPKTVDVTGENKQIYGYGFYNRFIPLKEKYQNMEVNYLPYELVEDKIKNKTLFKKVKRGSLVRVENKDLSDYKENSKEIYVVDYDYLYVNGALDFYREYMRKHHIRALFSLVARDQKTFEDFFPMGLNSGRKMTIDFKFNKDLFLKYYYENVQFNGSPRNDETFKEFFYRITKMLMVSKAEEKPIDIEFKKFNQIEKKKEPLIEILPFLLEWHNSNSTVPPFTFLMDKLTQKQLGLFEYEKDIRLLLKQKPKSLLNENIDFFEKL